MARSFPENAPPEWDLGDWEQALTINVGAAYVCRECRNLVMVTKGGVGVLDLVCCGRPMERVRAQGPEQKAAP